MYDGRMRSERFNMLMAPYERRMLDRLAEDRGVTSSNLVRMLVLEAFRAKFTEEEARREKRRDLKLRERDPKKGGA